MLELFQAPRNHMTDGWTYERAHMLDLVHGVRRIVEVYRQGDDDFKTEWTLTTFNLNAFQDELGEPDSRNPMFDSYEIQPRHQDFLDRYFDQPCPWDFGRFTYFLAARQWTDEEQEMVRDEANRQIKRLVKSPGNMQEFADLASIERVWKLVDKSLAFPRGVGGHEDECPACLATIRLIYDKFAGADYQLPLVCPHCRENLLCLGEYSGYTTEIRLEEA